MAKHYLSPLFTPQSVAVFGASPRPESVGGGVFRNLISAGFRGPLIAVNPKRKTVHGHKCFPTIAAAGERVDVAVIATPAATVPKVIEECGEAGVPSAIVLSAGFGEIGEAGKQLEDEMLVVARRYRMRVLGPNCLGVMRPSAALNLTFSKNIARPGDVALVSQSGALCTAILDWADSQGIGFSTVAAIGAAADIGFGEILDFLALDGRTRSILLYIEGIKHARAFLSGLRVAARLKPAIVMKAGRGQAGMKAAMSHTGAIVGADDVFNAALERAGAVRVPSIEELFAAARMLSSGYRVRGPGLAIVTNAGGLGVISADYATERQVELPDLAPATIETLDGNLPAAWSRGNPVDILGDGSSDRLKSALDACLADKGVNAVLAMITPQAMTDLGESAQVTLNARDTARKPVLSCWMGGSQMQEARDMFAKGSLPSFTTPESAIAGFSHLADHHRNQRLLLQVPGPLTDHTPPDLSAARKIVEKAIASGRSTLTGVESKHMLEAFRIPTTPIIEARSAPAAVEAAEKLGYPVVLKISSYELTHKSDVGGVELNLADAYQVEGAYGAIRRRVRKKCPGAKLRGVTVEPMFRSSGGRELLVGVVHDPVFGPVISFGSGGIAVEVFRDRAVALPPLNEVLIDAMISRTRVARLLGEFRNLAAVDNKALVEVLLRISEMVCEFPEIEEMDINPLIADDKGVLALDARFNVSKPERPLQQYGHMAIHPYPPHLGRIERLRAGKKVVIRPIRPEDAKIEATFIRRLSPESKFFRFMQALDELTPEMLVRFTQIDYDREMAFIATTEEDGEEIQVGVARYSIESDAKWCEFAIVVADDWSGIGLGTALMTALIEDARSRNLTGIRGEVLTRNHVMLEMMRKQGFKVMNSEDDSVRFVVKEL